MSNYELTLILNPSLSDSELQKLSAELRNILTQVGATDVGPARSERRVLAYPIRKQKEAIYLYINLAGPTSIPDSIQTELKHRDEILRLQFIRTHSAFSPSAPGKESPVSATTPEPTDG